MFGIGKTKNLFIFIAKRNGNNEFDLYDTIREIQREYLMIFARSLGDQDIVFKPQEITIIKHTDFDNANWIHGRIWADAQVFSSELGYDERFFIEKKIKKYLKETDKAELINFEAIELSPISQNYVVVKVTAYIKENANS